MSDTERDLAQAIIAIYYGYDDPAEPNSDELRFAKGLLESDWLAAHDAQVRAEERSQWADWIETWQESVTPEPITVDVIRDWLRADRRPFGIARAGGAS